MKRLVFLVPVFLLAAGAAFADGVTMRYRFDPASGPPFYSSGQALKLDAKRPATAAKAPKFKSRKPLYGQPKFGRGANTTFTFVLDEAKGTGKGYDTLYVDTNRDGSLTDEKPLTAVRRSRQITFGPFRLLVPIDGKRVLYHARVQKYDYDQATYQVMGLGCYTGMAAFGDKSYRVAVVDSNSNGVYGDAMKGFADESGMGDMFLVDLNGNGEYDYNSMFPDEICYVGKRIVVGGRYFDLKLSPDGSNVAVSPSQAPLAAVKADYPKFMMMLSGGGSFFPVQGENGTVQVPCGDYRAVAWGVTRKAENGASWELQSVSYGGGANSGMPVSVGENGCTFAPDTSLVAKPQAQVTSGGQVQFSLGFTTGAGQQVANIESGGQRPAAPTLKILDEAGAEVASLAFEYG